MADRRYGVVLRASLMAIGMAFMFLLAINVGVAQSQPQAYLSSTETVWEGHYTCVQGQTDLRLKMRSSPDGTAEAMFEFGATDANPGVPAGAFLMKGSFRRKDGLLRLNPVCWILQPKRYVMVGLTGIVSGDTYRGSIVGGHKCSDFLVTKQERPTARYSEPRDTFGCSDLIAKSH